MLRVFGCLYLATVIILVALARPAWPQQAHADLSPAANSGLSQGGQIFASSCAGCHGLDGRGGERAPNLTTRQVRRLSDQELSHIVKDGLPGTAMPAFHALDGAEINAVIAYLRKLQGAGVAAGLAGHPLLGKSLFFGKAKCSTCHMVQGEGGFIASDLTGYGLSHSPDEILHTIESPKSAPPASKKIATVLTRDGRNYTGLVRNQDNFSLQLQSLDGGFHLFTKSDIARVEYGAEPLMPANYGSSLSHQQLEDIVSYLNSEAGSPTSKSAATGH